MEQINTRVFTRYVIQIRNKKSKSEWGDWYREEDDHCINLEDAIEQKLHLRCQNVHLEYKVIKRKYIIEDSEVE